MLLGAEATAHPRPSSGRSASPTAAPRRLTKSRPPPLVPTSAAASRSPRQASAHPASGPDAPAELRRASGAAGCGAEPVGATRATDVSRPSRSGTRARALRRRGPRWCRERLGRRVPKAPAAGDGALRRARPCRTLPACRATERWRGASCRPRPGSGEERGRGRHARTPARLGRRHGPGAGAPARDRPRGRERGWDRAAGPDAAHAPGSALDARSERAVGRGPATGRLARPPGAGAGAAGCGAPVVASGGRKPSGSW